MAMGGGLSVAMLNEAYRCGIFPWFSPGQPILWWSTDPRFVLIPSEVKIPRSLAKESRKPYWKVTFDQDFIGVIQGCAETQRADQDGTWITPDMIAAYIEMHRAGLAHSTECWRDGELVGGCYGIGIGAAFYGESMFYRVPNASKVAFTALTRRLQTSGYRIIDCQQETAHLARFGATKWPRSRFLDILEEAVQLPDHWPQAEKTGQEPSL